MSKSDLKPHELMQIVVGFFETSGVNYRIVGSMASMAYGEPRFTNDIDVLAQLTLENLQGLLKAFPKPDFYLSEQAIVDAINKRQQFNILHLPSGLKIDVILPARSEYSQIEMQRGRLIQSQGEFTAWFCTPEDVILNKLLYYQMGGSEKHLRDIASILKLQVNHIDIEYILLWAEKIGVIEEWEIVSKSVGNQSP